MRLSQMTSCKGFIVNNEGKFLLLKRSRTRPYAPGRWDIPGGRLDKGENKVGCLKREILEEVGLKTDESKIILIDSKNLTRLNKLVNKNCYFVSGTTDTGTPPVLSREHSKYSWMSPNEIKDTNLPDFYKDCLEKIVNRPAQ